jgi:hypothetical protein
VEETNPISASSYPIVEVAKEKVEGDKLLKNWFNSVLQKRKKRRKRK